ncbi:MAG: tetratricopeptide repeat protein [Bdellovibrionales bacterium]
MAFVSALVALLFVVIGVLAFYGGEAVAAKENLSKRQVAATLVQKSPPTSKKARKMQEGEPLGIALSEGSQDSEVQDKPVKAAPATATKSGATIVVTKVEKKSASSEDSEDVERGSGDTLSLARKATQDGAWDKAIKLYGVILKKEPKNQAALQGKVFALSQRGRDEDLDVLDGIAEKNPSLAAVHAARARILVRQKDTMEALTAWQKAVALDPKNKDCRLGLAILNDKLGRQDEALKLYRAIPKPLPPEAQRRLDYLASHEASAPSSADDAGERDTDE